MLLHKSTPYLLRRYLVVIFFKLSLIVVFCTPCAAQFNFYKYSVGIGGGITLPYADTRKANYSLANQFVVDYYFTPYINTGLEFQFGNMRGGEKDKDHFTNTFRLNTWNARMLLGQFYDRYDRLTTLTSLMRGLYAGVGIGYIRNNVDAYKIDKITRQGIKITDVNTDIIFPLHVGINFYFKNSYGRDRWELNLNMQYVTLMADELDGDLNPYSNYNDVYTYYSAGVRYKFGTVGLDQRKNRLK